MRTLTAGLKLCALGTLAAACAFWHHGHIHLFLEQIADGLTPRLRRSKRRFALTRRPSQLVVQPADPAVRYELTVRRTHRALEIGLAFEGEAAEAARYAAALAERAVEIQARLGPRAQLEELTRRRFRLYESLPVGTGDAWQPKRDLTPELAKHALERLARYVEVLEPIVASLRGGASGRPVPPRRSTSGAAAGAASRSARAPRSARSRPA